VHRTDVPRDPALWGRLVVVGPAVMPFAWRNRLPFRGGRGQARGDETPQTRHSPAVRDKAIAGAMNQKHRDRNGLPGSFDEVSRDGSGCRDDDGTSEQLGKVVDQTDDHLATRGVAEGYHPITSDIERFDDVVYDGACNRHEECEHPDCRFPGDDGSLDQVSLPNELRERDTVFDGDHFGRLLPIMTEAAFGVSAHYIRHEAKSSLVEPGDSPDLQHGVDDTSGSAGRR
jgi:hypothetical protein